ncbi:MAG TPA: sugar phosphate isomerase/epimerase [Bryobacteraceae bacterium]|jgi:inosose dehydratase|nr:sugar phosphate isomerase/epimerase [Bryobacteraceae bacterium]
MQSQSSRRRFLAGVGAVVTAAVPRGSAFAPTGGANGIRFGYAAITWGKEGRQAIEDISATGFEGIQLRLDAITEFQPAELRSSMEQHKLTFVALSSGEISIDPAAKADAIAKHTANAKFVRDAGGLYLQILDQLKDYPRTVTADECRQLGKLLTEVGKRTADLGIPLAYHNHLNTISEHPANLDIVLENSDPKYVKLLFDTAHSLAGGGDPAEAIKKYHDRLLFLHLKDVVDIPRDTPGARYPFQFVELGRGKVDLPAVFAALDKVKFRGWAVVELDRVPEKSRTPKQSAMISRKYLEEKMGATLRSARG